MEILFLIRLFYLRYTTERRTMIKGSCHHFRAASFWPPHKPPWHHHHHHHHTASLIISTFLTKRSSGANLFQLGLELPDALVLVPVLLAVSVEAALRFAHLHLEPVHLGRQLPYAVRLRRDGAVLLLQEAGDVLQRRLDRFDAGVSSGRCG